MDTARHATGRLGETLAAWSLRLSGWQVIARNVRIAGVEVDLIARRCGVDALVEVKTRRSDLPLDLGLLLSEAQRRRLARAACAWSARRGVGGVRVDLFEVRLAGLRTRVIRHEGVVA